MEAVSNNKKSAIEAMFNYQVCDLGSDITSGIVFYRVTFNIKNPRIEAIILGGFPIEVDTQTSKLITVEFRTPLSINSCTHLLILQ